MKSVCLSAAVIIILLLTHAGCRTDDPVSLSPADKTPPLAMIAYPYDLAVVSGITTVRVLATDESGIKKVILYVDGLPLPEGEATEEPFEIAWNTLDHEDSSTHVLTARAYDIRNNVTDSDPVRCTVDNSGLYPSKIRLHPVTYRDGSFHVSWQEYPGNDFFEYLLFESTDDQLTDEQEIFSSRNIRDTSFVVADIPEGETRYYRVRVENEPGLVQFSNVRSATAYSGFPGGLIAYYPFSGNAGDETGLGHDGQVVSAVLTTDRYGNPGSAYHFDGSAYIEIMDHDDIVFPGGFTVAAWIMPEMATEHNNIISRVGPNRDFVMQLNAANKLNGHFYTETAFYHAYSGSPLPLNEWTHVAYVYHNYIMKLYVDGTLAGESTAAEEPLWTGEVMLIGAMSYTEHFVGSIDEVMVFGRALNDSEIQMVADN